MSATAVTRAVLAVRDEGPGIAPEHAEHIFDRFYRADASRTRESGGTGLGLAIVASIAEAHGGTARVETALGRGSTFSIELPVATPDGEVALDARSTPRSTAARRTVRAGQRAARRGRARRRRAAPHLSTPELRGPAAVCCADRAKKAG